MAALSCVPTVTVEKMQQWTECEQHKRQDTKHMRLMLADQEKAGDRDETEQGECGARAPRGIYGFV
jgi:predicted nucleotidyltransferase